MIAQILITTLALLLMTAGIYIMLTDLWTSLFLITALAAFYYAHRISRRF